MSGELANNKFWWSAESVGTTVRLNPHPSKGLSFTQIIFIPYSPTFYPLPLSLLLPVPLTLKRAKAWLWSEHMTARVWGMACVWMCRYDKLVCSVGRKHPIAIACSNTSTFGSDEPSGFTNQCQGSGSWCRYLFTYDVSVVCHVGKPNMDKQCKSNVYFDKHPCSGENGIIFLLYTHYLVPEYHENNGTNCTVSLRNVLI